MSMFSNRTAIISVWLGVFAMSALFGSPLTFSTGMLLLIGGIVPPVIMRALWKDSILLPEVPHHVERSLKE
jgi:hypothetical protein